MILGAHPHTSVVWSCMCVIGASQWDSGVAGRGGELVWAGLARSQSCAGQTPSNKRKSARHVSLSVRLLDTAGQHTATAVYTHWSKAQTHPYCMVVFIMWQDIYLLFIYSRYHFISTVIDRNTLHYMRATMEWCKNRAGCVLSKHEQEHRTEFSCLKWPHWYRFQYSNALNVVYPVRI